MVCGAFLRDREYLQDLCESLRGADHLRRIMEEAQIIVNDALAAFPQQPGIAVKTTLKEKP